MTGPKYVGTPSRYGSVFDMTFLRWEQTVKEHQRVHHGQCDANCRYELASASLVRRMTAALLGVVEQRQEEANDRRNPHNARKAALGEGTS